MLKPHHNLSYLKARLRQRLYQLRNPSSPWLVGDAIDLLDRLIRPTDVCVEFGSGRSTQWFAQRCASLTSVEHDERWYRRVTPDLAGFSNVRYLLRDPSTRDAAGGYVTVIEAADDASIDVILNDGKCRDQVALASLPKLRCGGLLIIDNAERYLTNAFSAPESIGSKPGLMKPAWKQFSVNIEGWRRIWLSDGVSTTLILFKP